MASLLQVRDLHAGYGRAEVLTGLNFDLAERQVVSVLGPNGAGKSTTLAALMGILPARGAIVFDGQDLVGSTLEERVMLGLALVQGILIFSAFNVRRVRRTLAIPA